MGKVRVSAFSLSFDGFGAGPSQDVNHPLGQRGAEMFAWFFKTKAFHQMTGKDGGATDVDNDFAEKAMVNVGAWILGRNMFGPIRGPWPDESWKGWWGDTPPYHTPVYVLTHHARSPIQMKGGTTFYFVTEGIHAALEQAKKIAGEKDVRIGGGVAVVREYLTAGLIDELHFAVAPVFLGDGEHLFSGLNLPQLGFSRAEYTPGEGACHVVLKKGL